MTIQLASNFQQILHATSFKAFIFNRSVQKRSTNHQPLLFVCGMQIVLTSNAHGSILLQNAGVPHVSTIKGQSLLDTFRCRSWQHHLPIWGPSFYKERKDLTGLGLGATNI